MDTNVEAILKRKLDDEQYGKLTRIDKPTMHAFVARFSEHFNPNSVFVGTDETENLECVRQKATETEKALKISGNTIHFDGYYDQAGDKRIQDSAREG